MSEKLPCSQCQAWMEDAFSGELEAAARPQLEAHLKDCAECRAVWADYQTLRRGMELLAETEGPSLRVQNNILRAAEAKAERKAIKSAGLWSWLLRPATVAFATLALIVGIGFLGRQELQKHKASEQIAPAVAPQGTPVKGNAEEAPAAAPPPAPAPKRSSAPLGTSKPAAPAAKPEAADLKQDAAGPSKDGDALMRAKQPVPEPRVSHEELPPAPPPPAKSLAKPPAPAQQGAASSTPTLLQAPTIPEAQSGFGGGLQDEGATQGADKEKKRELRAAPAEVDAQPSAEKNLQTEKVAEQPKEKESADRFQTLLNNAKAKIRLNNYSGALEDLLAAQRIRDTKEIQDLILLCRSHMRGDG